MNIFYTIYAINYLEISHSFTLYYIILYVLIISTITCSFLILTITLGKLGILVSIISSWFTKCIYLSRLEEPLLMERTLIFPLLLTLILLLCPNFTKSFISKFPKSSWLKIFCFYTQIFTIEPWFYTSSSFWMFLYGKYSKLNNSWTYS